MRYQKHVKTVEQVGAISNEEFATLNKSLHRSSGSGPTRSCIGSEIFSAKPAYLKDRQAAQYKRNFPKRIGPGSRSGAVCFGNKVPAGWNFWPPPGFTPPLSEDFRLMLVERGLRVMNVGLMGDAYTIASNYLRRSGAISGALATNDRLLKIIAELFQHGERNKIRLANKAIAKFEAAARH